MRILIADDEPTIADSLQMILSQDGFEVATAYDGESAVERARQFSPQILLCDVMMPNLNGVEVAIQVRTILPACRVLLFSGQAGVQDLILRVRAPAQTDSPYRFAPTSAGIGLSPIGCRAIES